MKLNHNTLLQNPDLGYYEIGGVKYWNKASALLEGTKLGFKYSDLHWNFNDDFFDKFNWTEEPAGSITEYYQTRARALREKYDYIILNCSGGADSTTMLYSFLQQGLFVDEIMMRHADVGTKKYQGQLNLEASNEHSEYEYAGIPLLQWVNKVSPKTKITVHDFSLDIINQDLTWDENFIYWCGDYVTPGCIVRYTHASMKDSLSMFDKGRSVGILFGTDKPRVYAHDNNLYLFFMDRAVHSATPATVTNGYDNINVELFYWAPESANMVAKQCHLIKNWFNHPMNNRLKYMLSQDWLANPVNRTVYESVIKGVIYEDYDLSTFQVNKPSRTVLQEWDYWINDHTDTPGYKTFMRGMIHLYQNIDKSFLRHNDKDTLSLNKKTALTWEYKPCPSNSYLIGQLT
jgi:hypothetical protein